MNKVCTARPSASIPTDNEQEIDANSTISDAVVTVDDIGYVVLLMSICICGYALCLKIRR